MIKISPLISFLLFVAVLFSSCFGGTKKTGCQTTPTAIFAGIDSFENHSFEVTGQDAIERIRVPQLNMDIEVFQSGCEFLQQEFRFHIHEPYDLNTPPDVCAMNIAGIFFLLSQFDDRLALFQQWAQALQTDAKQFKYNEKLLLTGSDIHTQIDKTHQTESAMLTVIFSQ